MFSFEVDHFILDAWSQFGRGPSKSLFIVIKKKKMSHSFIYTNQHSEFFYGFQNTCSFFKLYLICNLQYCHDSTYVHWRLIVISVSKVINLIFIHSFFCLHLHVIFWHILFPFLVTIYVSGTVCTKWSELSWKKRLRNLLIRCLFYLQVSWWWLWPICTSGPMGWFVISQTNNHVLQFCSKQLKTNRRYGTQLKVP